MKKKITGKETDKDSFSYKFATAMDYLQFAMQAFVTVPFMLIGAFLSGELGRVIEISENNCCTIAEAAAIWAASKNP
ncbi:MAG: hypothetical protein J5706_05215 [Elusimicrobiales bacterium]|nr:hypothetical protein [Elusimicrobiales bacterium]